MKRALTLVTSLALLLPQVAMAAEAKAEELSQKVQEHTEEIGSKMQETASSSAASGR